VEYTNINDVTIEEIRDRFRTESEYSCILPYITRDSEIFLSRILKTVLEEVNQENLCSHLEYTLNELSMNASKANSKRLYFDSIGKSLHNPEQYETGIRDFKEEVFRDFSLYEQAHVDKGFFVKITISKRDNDLIIEVINNSPMVQTEQLRIAQRLKAARKFNNLTEVLTSGFDSTEGAGFGLIIIILMLRKINVNENSLVFRNEEQEAITSLTIPLNLLSKEHSQMIADEISNEILQMPQFPESIINLQRELSDPNCTFATISDTVNSDPSLAAEILRIANSPVYMVRNKINDVSEAVRLIGMLGVKSVLYNYGVNQVFNKQFDKKIIQEINDHSFYVALIASYLARYKKLGRLSEDIYMAALLHDMGKIIVKALNRDLEEKLEKICREKHIPVSILDDLTDGYNHSLIGAEVAGKWNFPDKYISAIAYHHRPLEVEEEYKVLVYSVYLANEVYYFNKGERDRSDLNFTVLSFFGLENKDAFDDFINSLINEGLGA
jgi:putative nucleotidyltransferase with HDIG domain